MHADDSYAKTTHADASSRAPENRKGQTHPKHNTIMAGGKVGTPCFDEHGKSGVWSLHGINNRRRGGKWVNLDHFTPRRNIQDPEGHSKLNRNS